MQNATPQERVGCDSSFSWDKKSRRICATCRPRPKKPNKSVAWARCDNCDLWHILKDAPTSETWHCADANRQCGRAHDKE